MLNYHFLGVLLHSIFGPKPSAPTATPTVRRHCGAVVDHRGHVLVPLSHLHPRSQQGAFLALPAQCHLLHGAFLTWPSPFMAQRTATASVLCLHALPRQRWLLTYSPACSSLNTRRTRTLCSRSPIASQCSGPMPSPQAWSPMLCVPSSLVPLWQLSKQCFAP